MRTISGALKSVAAMSIVLATTVAVAGCGADADADSGGGGDPSSRARHALQLIAAGMEDSDGPRVCSLLFREAQEALMQRSGAANCIEAVARIGSRIDGELIDRFAGLAGAKVQVSDGVAHVTGTGPDALAGVLNLKGLWLSDFEDDWMVQGSAAAPSGSP